MLEIIRQFANFLVEMSKSMKTRAGGSGMQNRQSLINVARVEENAAIAQNCLLSQQKKIFLS